MRFCRPALSIEIRADPRRLTSAMSHGAQRIAIQQKGNNSGRVAAWPSAFLCICCPMLISFDIKRREVKPPCLDKAQEFVPLRYGSGVHPMPSASALLEYQTAEPRCNLLHITRMCCHIGGFAN